LGFLANSFEGGTWGCEEISGVCVFIAFLCGSFQKSLKGVHEVPPSPPLCASMIGAERSGGPSGRHESDPQSTS